QQHADPPHALALLRARRERPCRRAAEQRDEIAPLHAGHGDCARLQKTAAAAERPRPPVLAYYSWHALVEGGGEAASGFDRSAFRVPRIPVDRQPVWAHFNCGRSKRGVLAFAIYHLASDHCEYRGQLRDSVLRHIQVIAIEYSEIGPFADGESTLLVLLMAHPRTCGGIGAQRLLAAHKIAISRVAQAALRLAGDEPLDAHPRIVACSAVAVGAERERHSYLLDAAKRRRILSRLPPPLCDRSLPIC